MRWVALGLGIALLLVSAGAFTQVADTKAGQVAEVITLLAFGAGFVLALYGLAARPRPNPVTAGSPPAERSAGTAVATGSMRDLALGVGGVIVTAALVIGLAFSGGPRWAGFGFVILLPMLAGSVYLFWRGLKTSR